MQGPSASHLGPLRGKTRVGSKQAALIAMLRRPEGGTIAEIVAATGWQPHTVRGAFASAPKKRVGLENSSCPVPAPPGALRVGLHRGVFCRPGEPVGTAAIQGELWGAKAHDWAEIQEPPWNPIFLHTLDLAGVGADTKTLDIGCGAGGALVLARARGAEIAGVDASQALIDIARERLPGARLEVGEMEELPFSDGSFDAITGINAFQFAGDMPRALAEAARVCRPGGSVLMLVWGRPEECAVVSVVRAALGPYLSSPASPPPQLAEPGVIERFMERAGLRPSAAGDFSAELHYADADTAVRAFRAAGVATRIERQVGAEPVRAAVAAALVPYVAPEGRVSLANQFRWVRAIA